MFHRYLRQMAAIATISLVAGCDLASSGTSGDGAPIVVGTTSAPSTLDPAASWDGSWELFRNIYQTLLSYPVGASEPRPDVAERCRFTDAKSTVYRCTLKKGLKFSDGTGITAETVKYSIDRIRSINVKGGPAGLLGSLDSVETKGDREVVFRLNQSDATFPFVLATPAMSIVDPDDYPAKALRKDGKVTGSGPYSLASYEEGKEAKLVENPNYKGAADRHNDAVTIRYFQDSEVMVKALKAKQLDLAFRGIPASDLVGFQRGSKNDGLQLIEDAGIEINYLVFNPDDPWTSQSAVRRAVAQVIDRGRIAHDVYQGTVVPLYSMVPAGLAGHTTPFFDSFGKPNVEKAKGILAAANITQRVPLTLWYTTDRYGSSTAVEFKEIKRQLEASGLFSVTIKGRPWNAYVKGYNNGEYQVFGRGWFPDFPDPDNFIAPFVGEKNALGTPYDTPEITKVLLPESRRESDRAAVAGQFEKAQEVIVDDTRLLPLWQGKQYIAASDEIAGAERALDPSTIMMMWELYRKESW